MRAYHDRVTEKQVYDVVGQFPGFELRRYAPHAVAEVALRGSFEGAGSAAFRPLVGYLTGGNRTGTSLSMTSPVIQQPVDAHHHRVAFVLPAGSVAAAMPVPSDGSVHVRDVAQEYAAVVRFSGRWTLRSYVQHEAALRASVAAAGMAVAGPTRFARFDPPWKPGPLRRNEVVLPVRRP